MYSLPSTSHTWLPSARWRNSGATPRTSCVWPLLNVCVQDGMTFSARAKYSSERASGRGVSMPDSPGWPLSAPSARTDLA